MNLLTPPLVTQAYWEDMCCSPWELCFNACQICLGFFSERSTTVASLLLLLWIGRNFEEESSEETTEHNGVQEKGLLCMQGEHEGLQQRRREPVALRQTLRSVGIRGSTEIT